MVEPFATQDRASCEQNIPSELRAEHQVEKPASELAAERKGAAIHEGLPPGLICHGKEATAPVRMNLRGNDPRADRIP